MIGLVYVGPKQLPDPKRISPKLPSANLVTTTATVHKLAVSQPMGQQKSHDTHRRVKFDHGPSNITTVGQALAAGSSGITTVDQAMAAGSSGDEDVESDDSDETVTQDEDGGIRSFGSNVTEGIKYNHVVQSGKNLWVPSSKGPTQLIGPHSNLDFNSSEARFLTSSEREEVIMQARSKDRPIKLIDTETGAPRFVDRKEADRVVVEESSEAASFIIQMLKIEGQFCQTFYDLGANHHLVEVDFAQSANFELLSEKSSSVSAAGNTTVKVQGLWRTILGKDSRGQYYELNCTGMHRITSAFTSFQLSQLHDEVRQFNRENSGPISKGEPLPRDAGDLNVKLLIGIKSSQLLPELILRLPSGVCVFRMKLKDY